MAPINLAAATIFEKRPPHPRPLPADGERGPRSTGGARPCARLVAIHQSRDRAREPGYYNNKLPGGPREARNPPISATASEQAINLVGPLARGAKRTKIAGHAHLAQIAQILGPPPLCDRGDRLGVWLRRLRSAARLRAAQPAGGELP